MRDLVIRLGGALVVALVAAACISFDLDGRRFRCDGSPSTCGDGQVCGPDGFCVPASPIDANITGEICGNQLDDDGDLRIDCADSECPSDPTCGAGCLCDGGGPREVACMDTADNDGDGLRDCLDPDCPDICMGTTVCCADGTCRVGC